MPIHPRHKQRPGEWRDVLAPEIMAQYIGKHIAIVYKKVVAVGDTYDEVREQAEQLYPSEMPYLAYIADRANDSDGESAALGVASASPVR